MIPKKKAYCVLLKNISLHNYAGPMFHFVEWGSGRGGGGWHDAKGHGVARWTSPLISANRMACAVTRCFCGQVVLSLQGSGKDSETVILSR